MITEVSQALRDVIHQATPEHGPWMVLHSLSQADKSPLPDGKGVLALIALEEHEHLRNLPLTDGAAGLVRAPLALKLHYVATFMGDHDEAQRRLARIVQAFHTTPILRRHMLKPPLADEVETLTIRLVGPTHDQRNQIWGALGRPGRLALFYEVDVAPVPVLQQDGAGRVVEHRVEYVRAP
ncbi:Pvc16 family protein [Streptomyces sp. P17]|uniref:Pvc16 family protein n=1 Tax=Streptomyces sp. P17 TaxID=3074716 RepID=UPI0028F4085D|nr:Pvc16 family protein [Streptomyces sp. P17]MDT9694971.1 Pvc16 family protein [Streptomyces sp. P17]